ncbi:MAG: hypothetical protein WD200_03035 [Candidatus Andersenbacteria bacterium]
MFNTKLEFPLHWFSHRKAKQYILSPDGRAVSFVLLVVITFFITRWIFAGAWFNNDLVIITTPLENLYAHLQRSGQSPLWAPELAGGYPLFATGQLGFWYPPHMLLRQFLPAVWTLNLSMLLHSLLAAAGAFIFFRINKVNRSAGVVGALLLPLGGAFIGKYEMVNLILPFTWVPLLLLFLQLFIERGRLAFLFYWIIANTLCVLMGHPQMTVQIFILEAIFVLGSLALDWKRWLRALVVLTGAFLVVGLASFYLLPIIDNFSVTDRAQGIGADKDGLFEFSFTLEALKGIILPHPFGHGDQYQGPKNEAELSSYLGPFAILFALFGLFVGRKKFPTMWLFSVFMLVIGISLALGGDSPIYRWLVNVGWRYFNAPARFFLLANFGLVFLAAIGFHFIASKITRNYMQKIVIGLLTAGTIIPVFWVGWSWYDGVPWKYTKEPIAINILKQQDGLVRVFSKDRLSDIAPNNNFGIMLWDPVCSTCLYRQTFVSPFAVIQGINLKLSHVTEAGTLTMRLFSSGGEQLRETSLPAHNVIDSEWSTFSFQPLDNVLNQSLYFEITSDIIKKQAPRLAIHTNPNDEQYDPTGLLFSCKNGFCEPIKADSQTVDAAFAILTSQTRAIKGYELLTPYIPAGYGIGSAQWTGSLGILDVQNYLKPFGERGSGSAWQENRSLVNRFPITHVIGLFPPHRGATNLVDFTEISSIPIDDKFIRLYQNNEAFPRVYFVENVKAISGSLEQRIALSKINPQDEKTVVADIPSDTDYASGGVINSVYDKRSRVIIQTSNLSDGFLVMRDILLPGWTAIVDNNAVPIHLTDSLFRGISVPAGEHKVIFEYKPSWVKIATSLGIISLVILTVLGYFSLRGATVWRLPQRIRDSRKRFI